MSWWWGWEDEETGVVKMPDSEKRYFLTAFMHPLPVRIKIYPNILLSFLCMLAGTATGSLVALLHFNEAHAPSPSFAWILTHSNKPQQPVC